MSGAPHIALLGFGEVGQILAAELAPHCAGLRAYDVLFSDPLSGPAQAVADSLRAERVATAVTGASLVISAVTAARTLEAVESVCAALRPGTVFLDLNSAAPQTKCAAAARIAAAGGRYVEAAVMAPVPPKRLATPVLLGGPHAAAFLDQARDLGFSDCRVYADTLGTVSAAKLSRSILIKGLEALLMEALLTARHYRVEEEVLISLSNLMPGTDWKQHAHYMLSRAIAHGTRRAEEMREAALTASEAGVLPLMSTACAERQELAAGHRPALAAAGLAPLLDAIRRASHMEAAL